MSSLSITEHPLYQAMLRGVIENEPLLDELNGKTLLVTGSTGMIGSCLIDLLSALQQKKVNIRILAVSHHPSTVAERFGDKVKPIQCDLTRQSIPLLGESVDYILHLASNTHPLAYAQDPIGTIAMNVYATHALLEVAARYNARFLFASSVEIYGRNRGDVDLFDEAYCGYIDCNTLRAGYPESKRCGESLCQAFKQQKGVDFVIARIARSFGPTLKQTDSKALTQFLKDALSRKDIALKSEGMQYFSYLHVSDVVTGLLYVLLKGASATAYNIADNHCDIRLRDLAALIAHDVGREVTYSLPSDIEHLGASTATTARLDAKKLFALGWHPRYSLIKGVQETLKILQDIWE